MSQGSVVLDKDRAEYAATLTINRPGHGNLMTLAMARQFVRHLADVDEDDDIKVVHIRGAGENLSAGWHPSDAWQQYLAAPGGAVRKHPSQRARLVALDHSCWGAEGLYRRLLHCRKITIVEARGDCLDTGLYLTLCADLAVAAPDAVFGAPRWHNVGVDGDMSLLFASVGLKRAKELMYTNVMWSGQRAFEHGLVDRVTDDPGGAVHELGAMCSSIMRDGIVTEKYAVFASLVKMGVGHSFAATTVVAASMSNIHFQPGEYNFLRDLRDSGPESAIATSRRDFKRR